MRESDLRGFFGEETVVKDEGLKARAKEVARSYSLIFALLGLILVFLTLWAAFACLDEQRFRGEVIVSEFNVFSSRSDKDQFDYLTFTQLWPETSCIHYRHMSPRKDCKVPSSVKGWTVHGLWPSDYSGDMGPFYCNKSDHFDPAVLDTLEPTLSQRWPNLFVETEEDSLWKHEWLKHGTCAASIDELDSEKKYFGAGLDFWARFNLFDALAKSGVSPSLSRSYQAHDVFNAIKAQFGASPVIQCLVFRGQQMDRIFLLSQVELCFDKSLNLIDCKPKGQSFFEGCELGSEVYYPPPLP